MEKKSNKKRFHWGVLTFFFIVLFLILYILSSLSGLRFFIPHYFDIAGGPFSEKNYLVIFQNNYELRPSGGFISAYGVLKFRNGIFKGLEIKDVFGEIDDHEYIEPPYPQEELMKGRFYQGYTFRDANYYGDFPMSVTELVTMYKLTDEETVFDGVIAVNFKVLEDMIDVLNEIKVEDQLFTKDNDFELLEYLLHNIDYHNVEQIENRKKILGPLATALIKKSIVSPFAWRELSDMFVKNLNEKHIQLHFFDASFQESIDKKGWGGKWPEPTGDFLAVVEANLNGFKSDRYVTRDVDYRLEIWGEPTINAHSLIAKVRITMENFGSFNIPISGSYTGYIRTYMPAGSKLLSSNVEYTETSTSDYSVFGTIVKIDPRQIATIEYEVELPPALFDGKNYHLDLIKQAGTMNDNYSVIVEGPERTTLVSDESNSFKTQENFAIWEGQLLTDKSLDFEVTPDEFGPLVSLVIHEDLNNIRLVFNERISTGEVFDPNNITIEDMDITNPDVHDTIVVEEAVTEFRDIKLKISGMTDQPEEFYKLTIKNVYDLHGNPIEPTPKEITIVQRLNEEE